MRRFNAKLFFGLVFGSVLLVALTFLVHWLQAGRIATALLAQADRAEQEGALDQLARYLSRYLELRPDDIEARARLGQALSDEKMAVTPKACTRALFVLEEVLAKLPERRDLRLRLIRLALALPRRKVAREHLTRLTQTNPDDGEAEFLLGQLSESEEAWPQAAKWYRQAVRHAPQQIDAYVRLADVLRRHFAADTALVEEADQVMQDLIAQNKDACQAYLARWRYQQQWHDLAESAQLQVAAGDVQRALQLAPDDAEVLVAACELAQRQKDPEKARGYLRRGRQLFPQDVRMYRELAWLELREAAQLQDVKLR
jgi:tetratricopeptide (TPR) repeat protein